MSHVYVVNIRNGLSDLEGETVIRIDRADPILGNPFRRDRRLDLNERKRVLALHAQHVHSDLQVKGPISRALDRLAAKVAEGETVALQCWCAPLPCHGDLLAELINRKAQNIRDAQTTSAN